MRGQFAAEFSVIGVGEKPLMHMVGLVERGKFRGSATRRLILVRAARSGSAGKKYPGWVTCASHPHVGGVIWQKGMHRQP
jgi:hypothetical protein